MLRIAKSVTGKECCDHDLGMTYQPIINKKGLGKYSKVWLYLLTCMRVLRLKLKLNERSGR